MADSSHRENVAKLGKLIKDIEVAMLTTVDEEGCLRSRPMMTQKVEFDGQLWFFTQLATAKVHEIEHDQHVNLAYSNPSDQVYVSVSGKGRVTRERAKMEELWNPVHKAWFPKGLDDPNLALLCVEVEKAEYWDAPSGMIVQAIGFTKAILTGKPYDEEVNEHEKISLRK